jgi:hypothetical protein
MRNKLRFGLVFIGLLVVVLILTLRSQPSGEPFKFNVARYTNTPTGMCALVEFSNRTRTDFHAVIYTQTPTDAGWQRSSLQPKPQVTYPQRIHGHWTHRWLIPIPMDSPTWRLEIGLSKDMNKKERNLDSFLNRVHLHWPFHRSFNPSKPERVITSPVFNRPQTQDKITGAMVGSVRDEDCELRIITQVAWHDIGRKEFSITSATE